MEISEPKLFNPDNIYYGVNSLTLGGLHIAYRVYFQNYVVVKFNVYCKVIPIGRVLILTHISQ